MALEARCDWLSKVSGQHEVEYILSLDDDDVTADLYKEFGTVVRGSSRGCVDAYNRAYEASSGDILIQMHDDLDPPQNWDQLLAQRVDINEPRLLHVSDGNDANPDKPWLATISICSRKWAEKLGGLFHPGYVSVFCDDDASLKAQEDDCLVDARNLVFQHRFEGPDRDETQRRSYAPENWALGASLLEDRKKAGFPDFEG
jgi:glycosyltransferase involved in cell wall biosynthesis